MRARNLTEIPVSPARMENSPPNHDRLRPASMQLEVLVDQPGLREHVVVDEEADPAASEPDPLVQRLHGSRRGRVVVSAKRVCGTARDTREPYSMRISSIAAASFSETSLGIRPRTHRSRSAVATTMLSSRITR
jgi:hypothetical protein